MFEDIQSVHFKKQQVGPGTRPEIPRRELEGKAAPSPSPALVRHQVRHPEMVGSGTITHFWMAQATPEKHCLLSFLL